MMKRAVVVAVLAAVVSIGAWAKDPPAPKSPHDVAAEYCRLDFEGALTSSDGWPTISPLFVWPDAPGWDTFVVVRSYKLGKENVTGRSATVVVTYEVVGILDSTPHFKPACPAGSACKVSVTVTFHLVYSNQHWVMDKDGNPDHEEASGPAVWKIDEPQNGPHVSYRRGLKMAGDFLEGASEAPTRQRAQQTIEALKKAGE